MAETTELACRGALSRTSEAEAMNRSLLDDLPEPPLFGEEWVTALFLKMLVEHCATGKPYDLSSHGIAANEDAMHELNGAEIEITHETAQVFSPTCRRKAVRCSKSCGPSLRRRTEADRCRSHRGVAGFSS